MKILVTGATGFIGSALCLQLAEAGNTVHAIGRSVLSCRVLQHKNIVLFEGDILDILSVEKAARGCQQAYHLAAFVKARAKSPGDYFENNVQGTLNVMDACVKSGINRVVFTSTCGTFPSSGEGINDESVKRNPPFFNDYAASKYKAETMALVYIKKGLEVVVVSPTRVFGPGPLNESNSLSKLIKLYVQGKWRILPGDGKALGNYAFIEDVADGHVKAMKSGRIGEHYLLGGENISLNGLIALIKKEIKSDRWMIKVNKKAIFFLISLQEVLFKLFNKPPFITVSWFKRLGENSSFSSNKAQKELGYRITPVSEGVRRTIQWLMP